MLNMMRLRLRMIATTSVLGFIGSFYAVPALADIPNDPPPPKVSAGMDGDISQTAHILVSAPAKEHATSNDDRNVSAKAQEIVDSTPDLCWYLPQSSADAIAAGYDPTKGTLSIAKCPVASLLPGLPDGVRWVSHEVFTPNGEAPVAPPPDPVQLAQTAATELTVPAPVLHVGTSTQRVAVKVPVWLWVDHQPAITATVSAGGLTVTAQAVLTSTEWSMGDPVDDPDQGPAGTVSNFTCTGGGTARPVIADSSATAPCGYTYIWRSTAARTGGTGTWPVTVTAHWTLTWQATNGATGTIPLRAQATDRVAVGEWRVELVAGAASGTEPGH